MKKLVIAVVAAAALNTVSAQSCASAFSGFYAGLQAGMNADVGTYRGELPDINVASINFKGTRGSQSFIGGLFLGYGMGVGSCAYVGAELYGNFTNDKTTLFDNAESSVVNKLFTFTSKTNANFGAKLRLGYTVSQQAMIFLGLGLEYAQWQTKAENVMLAQDGVETVTKKNARRLAFAPSVGAELFLSKNLFTRVEYTYVATGSVKVEPQYRRIVGGVAVLRTGTIKSNINQHRFTLGLGYKF